MESPMQSGQFEKTELACFAEHLRQLSSKERSYLAESFRMRFLLLCWVDLGQAICILFYCYTAFRIYHNSAIYGGVHMAPHAMALAMMEFPPILRKCSAVAGHLCFK
jgi:hypothetical protein